MKIITASQMRRIDQEASNIHGIPSLVLMENAGIAITQYILKNVPFNKNKKILICCGAGNNGGDGLVVARHLQESGVRVQVYLLQKHSALKGDARVNFERYSGTVEELSSERALRAFKEEAAASSLIVDAIFGIGLNRKVQAWDERVIQVINAQKCPRLSVDIPSGLNADTGEAMGVCVQANLTCCLHLPKRGLLLGPDVGSVGQLSILPIGIPKTLEAKAKSHLYFNSPELFASIFQARKKESYKHQYGHVITVAGSVKKIGAGLLCARAALRAGAGLSTLALPESAYEKIDPRYAEIMFEPIKSGPDTFLANSWNELKKILQNKNSMACGPGMGTSKDLQKFMEDIITHVTIPLVLDADALNNIAEIKSVLKKRRNFIVLTPHLGEMQRLSGLSKEYLLENKLAVLRSFAKKYRVHVVLKAYRSLIATPEGRVYVNGTGNPGMATAGTGDVLTGIIAGFLAQGLAFEKALLAAVWIHGRAGDKVALERGEAGMLSWDIAEKVPEVLQEIQNAR